MSRRVRKLTSRSLKAMIIEEARKMQLETLEQGKEDSEKVVADETEADEYAGSLEKDIDYVKALKIQEEKLNKKLQKIEEARRLLKKRISSRI